jgi:hypothetical protein
MPLLILAGEEVAETHSGDDDVIHIVHVTLNSNNYKQEKHK